ncbi:dienelactone hydrolase family protein [Acidiphilium sp. PA]|uniref:dienelactone hydrolase family protein n=1 Tax=Acidiphilium sp. PA TaxID=2871705 RepID=UPI0022448801|nr:dienelactone hydrolase family protein [Acidiphilium sp. PA]MCW8309099.1 dienelactone hydrolase family protein [Acidiphilium sp. PA]
MTDKITTTTGSIDIKAADGAGSFKAYTVTPSTKPTGAVVVIQEIFGVNDALRATCHEIAEMGYIAVAPDLFWRQEPGVDITDKSEAEWKKAFALMNGFDQDKGIEDLKTTLDVARHLPGCNGKVGTVGFCLGGRLAVMMATRSDADVNVSYYGVMLDKLVPEFGNIKHPLLVHIAEQDEFANAEVRAAVLAGAKDKPEIETHVYPGVQHAFARVNGVHYDRRAATIANGRTAEALVAALG